MNVFNDLIGSNIRLTISGQPIEMYGYLVDAGSDIVVIQSEKQFYYIPIIHIQNMSPAANENINNQESISYPSSNGKISFISTLTSAKEIYSEIYVTGLHSLHGYITGITSDCFTFHSPVSGMVLIQTKHLKYLVPYSHDAVPYSLSMEKFPIPSANGKPKLSFCQQLQSMIGNIIVIDLADHPHKCGMLKAVDQPIVELILPNGSSSFFHLEHIKSVNVTFKK